MAVLSQVPTIWSIPCHAPRSSGRHHRGHRLSGTNAEAIDPFMRRDRRPPATISAMSSLPSGAWLSWGHAEMAFFPGRPGFDLPPPARRGRADSGTRIDACRETPFAIPASARTALTPAT